LAQAAVTGRRFAADALRRVVAAICAAAGSEDDEAAAIARRLVDANLAGHDSHGVIRLPRYIRDLANGGVIANRHASVVLDTGALIVIDGNNGFGQVIGAEAMTIGIAAARRNGACVLVLRHSAHLGRIADWAEMAADAGLAAFHFVNVTGTGTNCVAPFGGTDGRLATNPIAAAIPRPEGGHITLDMATSVVAEGKIAVAANRGIDTPEGWLIDGRGKPTRNPRDLYGDPRGAIMPFGAHKGYGLSLFVDLLAGALTGAGGITHRHEVPARVENNMIAMIVDPDAIGGRAAFDAEVASIIGYVTASAPANPDEAVLAPGDVERATRAERLANGIPIEAETWSQIVEAGASLGMRVEA
jgi:uncharacterized oxidoreductase